MKKEDLYMKKIYATVRIRKSDILKELTRRTSYTAMAVTPGEDVKPGWSDKIIISSDEYGWCEAPMAEAFSKIRDVLFAYAANGCEGAFVDNGEDYLFRLAIDSSAGSDVPLHVTRNVKEAFVSYILSVWFSERIPEKAAYLMSQFEVLMSMVRVSLCRRKDRVRRPVSYF